MTNKSKEEKKVFKTVGKSDVKNDIKKVKMTDKEAKEKIFYNFKLKENIFLSESKLRSTHEGITGNNREEFWAGLFEKMIPNKFSIETNIVIIDSYGSVSHEVDIAIIDSQYTPFVFIYGNIKFVPIEAVAVVVECKSSGWDDEFIEAWSNSIEKLKTKPYGIARMVQGVFIGDSNISQKRTSPIKILASLKKNPQDKTIEKLDELYDFFIYRKLKGNVEEVMLYVPNEKNSLGWWSSRLNCFVERKELETEKEITIENEFKTKPLELLNYSIDREEKEKLDEDSSLKFKYTEAKSRDEEKRDIYNISTTCTLENLRIEDNVFMTLNFQLNQLLMLINNPMLYPHFEYAALFNKMAKESKTQKGE